MQNMFGGSWSDLEDMGPVDVTSMMCNLLDSLDLRLSESCEDARKEATDWR